MSQVNAHPDKNVDIKLIKGVNLTKVLKNIRGFCALLFYTIATVIQLYHGSDMMYEMRRGKPESTLLPAQGIFNLPHHIYMP